MHQIGRLDLEQFYPRPVANKLEHETNETSEKMVAHSKRQCISGIIDQNQRHGTDLCSITKNKFMEASPFLRPLYQFLPFPNQSLLLHQQNKIIKQWSSKGFHWDFSQKQKKKERKKRACIKNKVITFVMGFTNVGLL